MGARLSDVDVRTAIIAHFERTGVYPTVRELARTFGVSHALVYAWLRVMYGASLTRILPGSVHPYRLSPRYERLALSRRLRVLKHERGAVDARCA